jgi:hypothetical protein
LGGKVIGSALALELIKIFLISNFSGAARHRRRLQKVQALERKSVHSAPIRRTVRSGRYVSRREGNSRVTLYVIRVRVPVKSGGT